MRGLACSVALALASASIGPAAATPLAGQDGDTVPWEDFTSLERWTHQEFDDRPASRYSVADDGGNAVLRAVSARSASLLLRQIGDGSERTATRVSWRWRVDGTFRGGPSERTKAGDDYVARVFVLFGEPGLGPGTRALCYVWGASEPEGAGYPSPYADGVWTVVLRSGDDAAGAWIHEDRDVIQDYVRAFAEPPPPLAAIGIMSDGDDTGVGGTAWVDDIVLR